MPKPERIIVFPFPAWSHATPTRAPLCSDRVDRCCLCPRQKRGASGTPGRRRGCLRYDLPVLEGSITCGPRLTGTVPDIRVLSSAEFPELGEERNRRYRALPCGGFGFLQPDWVPESIRVNQNRKISASICSTRTAGQEPGRGSLLRQKATTGGRALLSSVALLGVRPEPRSLPLGPVPGAWIASAAFSSGLPSGHRIDEPNRTGTRWRRRRELQRSFWVSCGNQPCSADPSRAKINRRRQTASPSVMTPKRGGLRRR